MAKRKEITKKVRFEVFKRDSFKCQYCGSSAPDVILHVDHIKPVVEGGTNNITNLITSCSDCNLGKGPRLLDDDSVIKKQKEQLDELNQKRQQLEMMMEWREGIKSIEEEKIKILKNKWSELSDNSFILNELGEKDLKKMLKKFDLNLILDCMELSFEQYVAKDKDGEFDYGSINKAFNYVGRICTTKSREQEEPYLKDLYYIRGILRNRLAYLNEWKALQYLKDAYQKGASIESLKEIAIEVKNWTQFSVTMEDFLDETDG